MKKNSFIKILISVIITLGVGALAFAQDQRPDFNRISGPSGRDSQEEVSLQDEISGFFHKIFKPKKNIQQARLEAQAYRQKGIELQEEGTSGSIEKAEIFFKQAIELDPYYADAYNDLGVIYEAKGSLDIAQQYYLKAIEANPDYLNSYSNLALLYEGKSDLKRAYYYWDIRARHGGPNDEWTKKAQLKALAIRDSVPELRNQYLAEITQQMNSELNKELEEQKRVERLKTQTKKDRLDKINQYFEKGMKFYQKDNLQAAKQEFDKIIELTASPQGS